MVKVYVTDVSFLNNDIEFEKALSLLPQWRREAVLRIRVREKQALSIAAYLLAKRVLTERGIDAEIAKEENGRPFVEGNPVYISISHSAELAAVAVYHTPIGLDIEKNRPEIPGAVKIFSEEIRNKIKTPQDFFEHWTRYEAHIKCQKPKVCFYKTVIYNNYTISACCEHPLSHLDVCPVSLVPSDFS